jgi:hypothetical protein
MTQPRKLIYVLLLATLFAAVCVAQFRPPGGFDPNGGGFPGGGRGRFGPGGPPLGGGPITRTEGGIEINEETVRTARETASHSTGTPNWTNTVGFAKDGFVFTRAKFSSRPGSRGWRGSWTGWLNDYPDSDLNLSFRLQQMTSILVNPDGRIVHLNEPDLFEYPMIFMLKPGGLEFQEDEVPQLRQYLLNGGALWADDFWGTLEWDSFESQMKRVFPDRQWVELGMDHPIFHGIFELKMSKNELQVPAIHFWERSGNTSRNGEDSKDVHIRAWLDDRQRIMVLATHNTDTGDGWEREGENDEYFHKFSERVAFPLAINVIFHLMTH